MPTESKSHILDVCHLVKLNARTSDLQTHAGSNTNAEIKGRDRGRDRERERAQMIGCFLGFHHSSSCFPKFH